MRQIKLTGREATVVRAIGFTESMLGAEIQDFARIEGEDVTDTLNSLMAGGSLRIASTDVLMDTPPFV